MNSMLNILSKLLHPILCIEVYFTCFGLDLGTALIATKVNPVEMYMYEQNRIFIEAIFHGNWFPWLAIFIFQIAVGLFLSQFSAEKFREFLTKKALGVRCLSDFIASIFVFETIVSISARHLFGAFTNVYFILSSIYY